MTKEIEFDQHKEITISQRIKNIWLVVGDLEQSRRVSLEIELNQMRVDIVSAIQLAYNNGVVVGVVGITKD